MAYSDNFPAQRPVFQADFANGGRIDPRATFTRASTANVWDGSKHLSSDNLLLQSSDFDTTWFSQGLTSRTGGQTDPSGGTSGFTLLEDSATNFHRIAQSIATNGELALTVYAKRNAGSRYLNLTIATSASSTGAGLATFDLAGGATHTSNGASSTLTNLSATQTASGNGYYKCVFKATATTATSFTISLGDAATPASNNYGLVLYTGDGSSSLDVAFASLSTTGATDYNATTTQIHREYAPSLVSKSNNVGRFDYSTDGQSIAKGILIESQSTNLLVNSADFGGSWQIINSTKEIAAIGPDGTLSAVAFREGTNSLEKRLLKYYGAGGGNVTISVYAKLMGNTRRLVIREANASAQSAVFDIATGTKVSGNGSIESVGNGWYRCQLNFSSTGTTQAAGFYLIPADGGDYTASAYAGDGYSGLLLALPQAEDQSHASTYIDTGTSGSTATRASESLSVATADIGYTGGPFTIVSETEGGYGAFPRAFTLTDGTPDNRIEVHKSLDPSTSSTGWYAYASVGGATYVIAADIPSSAGASKVAISYDTNDVGYCAGGNTVGTDTSAYLPSSINALHIGSTWSTSYNQLNGHIKRIALYGEALSDQNLQSLTAS